jgi:hypothetical protein
MELHENLGVLHFLPADVFGNGEILHPNQGVFHWGSDWSQEDTEQIQTSEDSCHAGS